VDEVRVAVLDALGSHALRSRAEMMAADVASYGGGKQPIRELERLVVSPESRRS